MSGQNYSLWSLLKHGLRDHKTWEPAWRRTPLAPSYDVVIVGGGGHGLATAYYLAKEHRVGRIAVLEKGTTVASSLAPGSAARCGLGRRSSRLRSGKRPRTS